MGTIVDKLDYLRETKETIKNSINSKLEIGGGGSLADNTPFRQYAEKIDSIVAVPNLTNEGAAEDLRSGKQLVGADGLIIAGTLQEVEQSTPSISVSSSGLITASSTQSGGIIASGSKSATKQLTTQAGTTITPGATQKTACASGRYTTGNIYVAGDSNLLAKNIAKGVKIFGVTGTHSGIETITMTLGSRLPNNARYSKFWYVNGNGEVVELISGSIGSTFSIMKNSIMCYKGSGYEFTSFDVSPYNAITNIFWTYQTYREDVQVADIVHDDFTLTFESW